MSIRLSLSKRKKLKTEITHAKGEVRQQGGVTETLVDKEEPSSLKISNESSSLDITNDESEPFSQKMDKEVSQLQINMKIRKELQEKIAIMKKEWLQRKRKCLDFLEHLEHSSDGEITADMCFNGHQNAPFKLKSDKEAITEALDEYNSKTNQPVKVPKKKKNSEEKVAPDPSFIGVELGAVRGKPSVIRVYAKDVTVDKDKDDNHQCK